MSNQLPRLGLRLQHGATPRPDPTRHHVVGLISTLLLIASVALYAAPHQLQQELLHPLDISGSDCQTATGLAVVATGIFYLIAALSADTLAYLWNLDHVESILTYAARIRTSDPTFEFSCRCYHFEQRVRYVTKTEQHTTYVDGKSVTVTVEMKVPEVYQVEVTTHTEARNFVYSRCQDASSELNETIHNYLAVRVDCEQEIYYGDGATRASYDTAKANFIASNKWRDTHFDFGERSYIPGFKKRLLSIVDLSQKSPLMHWFVYVLATLLLLSWPYRLWFDSRTMKGHLEFKKYIFA
jgi:hypothetical protein